MLTYYLLGGIGKYKPSIYLARIPISHNEIGSLILDKIMKHKGKSMMKDFFALLDKLNESALHTTKKQKSLLKQRHNSNF